MAHLLKVAAHFNALLKLAVKERVNRNRLIKLLQEGKKQNSSLKKNLDSLEINDARLKSKLDKVRSDFDKSRRRYQQLQDSLKMLDVANAEDLVLYDNGETGYFLGGKEYHASRTEDGGVHLEPMRSYRRKQRGGLISVETNSGNENLTEESEQNDVDDSAADDADWNEDELHKYWWEE